MLEYLNKIGGDALAERYLTVPFLIAKLKSPPILFLRGYCGSILSSPWPISQTKCCVCRSVFVVKSPNLLSTECTTPTVSLNRKSGLCLLTIYVIVLSWRMIAFH